MLKMLAIGDMHIGVQPVPALAVATGIDLSPVTVWHDAVETAIAQEVDAVLLAGDLVHHDRDMFEAFGELERGLRKLADNGIRVLAIAGNHDVHVLPRLAELLEDMELLGRGGTWESATFPCGDTTVTVHGWSFPSAHVSTNPLSAFTPVTPDGIHVGLLHGDLDQKNSRYAPFGSADLDRSGVDAWLLGHIHAPSRLSIDTPRGYLGSLSPLDPTETGRHGPWRIDIDGSGVQAIEQIPLARIRFERLDVDVTGCDDANDVRMRLIEQVRAQGAALIVEDDPVQVMSFRVSLVGRLNHANQIAAQVYDELSNDAGLLAGPGDRQFHIDRIVAATRPALDLDELSQDAGPLGLTATRLQRLASGDTGLRQEMEALVKEVRRELLADAALTRIAEEERAQLLTTDADPQELAEQALTALLERMDDSRERRG